ncbi:MAG TPA: hypothetical protein VM469_06125 [Pseudoxanthomonas sp.]|nr:hypothetical protein [Pseudoxanthomonas sp.]
MIALALLPLVLVLLDLARAYLAGADLEAWGREEIWPIALLQLLAVGLFWAHALTNPFLEGAARANWLMETLIFIPVGMFNYWRKYIWNPPAV